MKFLIAAFLSSALLYVSYGRSLQAADTVKITIHNNWMTGAIVAAKVQGQKVLGGVAVGQSGSFNSQPGLDLTIYAQVGIAVCQRTVPSNDTTYEVRGTLLQFTCSP